MPELPEVETVRRGLMPTMEGAEITQIELRRKTLRYPLPQGFATRHVGTRVVSVGRRAKYILVNLDSGHTIIIHLGMSGSMGVERFGKNSEDNEGLLNQQQSRIVAHDHVIFHLECKDKSRVQVIYNDPRRFGYMDHTKTDELEKHKFLKNLGIEPLSKKLNSKLLEEKFGNKKCSVKAALLDQRIIAGLGNIYVCEALWRSGVSPLRLASEVRGKKVLEKLCGHIVEILLEAIKAGGSSLRDHKDVDGKPGYFQHQFAVYDQENQPCSKKRCNGNIQRIVQSGRSSYFCPKCQK